ncbi:MAG: RIP metalloprotease RseP [Gemmatimonadota bacterium]|nr:RIP metalloprotease RseP [Gemmatimonadota bacterium]
MTIIATIIVLGVLIFVHELGHFGAAKAVGIEVQRFSIGLGPKVLGVRWGETEYVFSAIPLGGYVKMGGMDDEVLERVEGGSGDISPREPKDSDYDAKPIWARTLVISAGVIMNMIFAFATYAFVFAQWGIPEPVTTRIGAVAESLLPPGTEALATVDPGSRIVRIGDREVTRWRDIPEGLLEAPAGPALIELLDPSRRIEIDLPRERADRVSLASSLNAWIEAGVGATIPGSPADRALLEPGDRITAVDGRPVGNWFDLVAEIEAHPAERIELTLEREGRELIRAVTPDAEEEERDGVSVEIGRIGVFPPASEMAFSEASLGQAVRAGYGETVAVTSMILGFLRDLVTGNISPRSMGSIVTIGEASGQAAEAGFDQFLRFMALFSINLAVLNLLPIPVLDGGHLVFLGIEAIRGGRGLTIEQRMRWSQVGFVVLLGIMLWALGNDFLRLFGL